MQLVVTAQLSWIPDNLELASRLLPKVYGIKPLVFPCFWLLVRRLRYCNVREHFRVSVEWLRQELAEVGIEVCTKTVQRYLAWLKKHGWITREQSRIPDKDGKYPQAWTGLADKALIALGLIEAPLEVESQVSQEQPSSPEAPEAPVVCGTHLSDSSKLSPTGTGKPLRGWKREPRIPASLAALKARIGAIRTCWLMGLCKAQGVRLQDYAAAFLAEDPVAWVRQQLKKLAQPGWWSRRDTGNQRDVVNGKNASTRAGERLDAERRRQEEEHRLILAQQKAQTRACVAAIRAKKAEMAATALHS